MGEKRDGGGKSKEKKEERDDRGKSKEKERRREMAETRVRRRKGEG